ncbi:hypothetical protein IQ266_16055 [filamentous cyanobacterium LEGE 11480]|uniref:Uncharacterized protein n=1 Tax=Romeriopsis navalis LEGE 11480 TaxID=2777977 RepID=A0A928Z598_9CYAN|nr:hypothetical protein [Romeriopsis navalis]MBE9031248.1 hypothetical protein [Romeriopsis navalis LEGE 11480]
MLNYATLDAIADAYIPLLAVLVIVLIARAGLMRRGPLRWLYVSVLICGLIVAYSLGYIDATVGLWSSFSLDYSTHTAVALVLVILLNIVVKRYWPICSISLFCYFGLMLYQSYHSVADIVTTVIAVSFLFLPTVIWLYHVFGVATSDDARFNRHDRP